MAQSKEADMTKLVESLIKISNSVAEKSCPRSKALITELENHYVTNIQNSFISREFTEANNVCGMMIPSAATTWRNWMQGCNKSSWEQTELIGILYGAWVSIDEFKLVFKSFYCECMACTKEKSELWEIRFAPFNLLLNVRVTTAINGDSQLLFTIPEFEYNNACFMLLKRIMSVRNERLFEDLSHHMMMFPTEGFMLAEAEDEADAEYLCNKRKRCCKFCYYSMDSEDDSENSLSSSTLTEGELSLDASCCEDDQSPLKRVCNSFDSPYAGGELDIRRTPSPYAGGELDIRRTPSPYGDPNFGFDALKLDHYDVVPDYEASSRAHDIMDEVVKKLKEHNKKNKDVRRKLTFTDLLEHPEI